MRKKNKTFFWKPLPQNHFQIRFCHAKGRDQIVWAKPLELGVVIKRDHQFVSTNNQGLNEILKMPFSGKILRIEDNPEAPPEDLFFFQKCEHIPILGPQNIEVCQICDEQLLSYEDKQQICFRKRDFKQVKNFQSLIEWNVAINQSFSRDKILGTCGQDQISLDFPGRVVFIDNPKDRQDIILKVRKTICLHEQVTDNICLQCHAFVSVQKVSMTAQKNGVVTSGRLLQKLQTQFVNNLKSNKKLLLILDLDNTLIHAIQNYPGDQLTFQNDECLIIYANPIRYLVKFRPFMRQFLEKALPKFDIYIYTKGTRTYAEKICEYMRKTYGDLLSSPDYDDFFTPKRIISRDEDTSLTKKSLQKIIKNHEGMILILDDRKDVWQQCRRNVVNTRFYKHYERFENKISILPSTDHYFYFTTPFIMQIHQQFFKEQNQKQDTRTILRVIQRQRLSGIKAFFLLQQNLRSNPIYCRGVNLGITHVDWAKTSPNIFIYSPNFVHKDSQKLKDCKIPVIHQLWIQYCYLQNYRFSWQLFDVTQSDHISNQTIKQRAEFQLKLFESHKIEK